MYESGKVPGRKAGGCPLTPGANNNTATESAAAAEGDHKKISLLTYIITKISLYLTESDCF